jgi:hypothetical protein
MISNAVVAPVVSWPLSYRVIGNNSGIQKQFSALLDSCGFLSCSGTAPITIKVGSTSSIAATPRRCDALFNWRDLSIRRDAERVWFNYRVWGLELDLTTLTLKCWGPDCDVSDELNFREFFLLSPLLFLMHRLGYFEMHAAACILGDHGYLFVGPSGSGKTSTLLSLIGMGAKYLSDDAISISRLSGGSLSVRPLRRCFSLKADYLRHDPEIAAYATEVVPGTDKRRIDPRQIWPAQYVSSVQPQFIVMCRLVNQETSEIVAMPKPEALGRLIASTPWIAFDEFSAPIQLAIFRSLAESCHTFELRAGRDVFRNGNRLLSLLAPSALT